MRIVLDSSRCEGHAVCLEIAPDLFDLADDDTATVSNDHPQESAWARAKSAEAGCPRQAISLVVTTASVDKS